ncbi:MAG: YaeQ family protein [Gemmatimonadota bacterium]|nr:YaeQ family protein [Gemmatimonadota bacterium]
MALTATIYNFDIELANVDRNVYATLALRVAQQPSETEEYLLTRVIAYGLEYAEGIAFSRGIAEPDEPPLAIRDLTGTLKLWVEFGAPDAARLHKASKAAPRVAIYTHRDPLHLLRQYAGERIHRVEEVDLFAVDGDLLAGLIARLDRRMSFQLSVMEGHLYFTLDGDALDGAVVKHSLVPAA